MEVARDAWRLLRLQPRQALLPFAIVMGPLTVVSAVASTVMYLTVFSDYDYPPGYNTVDAAVFATLVLVAASAIFTAVAQGAGVTGSAAAFRGEALSLSAALDPAFTRMGALLGLVVMLGALLIGLAATLVGLPLALILGVRLFMAIPVLMLEGHSPLQAMQGSWRLARGHFWRLAGLIGLLLVLALPFGLVLNGLLAASESLGRDAQVLVDGVSQLVLGLAAVPLGAYVAAATTVYYLKLREAQS